MTTHANSRSREYQAWWRMKQNCLDKNYPGFKKYGAKGITICQEWKDFIRFLSDMGAMPSDCNGIVRLDPNLHFCKINCKWDYISQGRPSSNVEPKKRQFTKKKRVKDPKTLCLAIEKSHYEFINKQALALSQQKGKIIQVNDLIRDALAKAFPCPETYDMFGNPK